MSSSSSSSRDRPFNNRGNLTFEAKEDDDTFVVTYSGTFGAGCTPNSPTTEVWIKTGPNSMMRESELEKLTEPYA